MTKQQYYKISEYPFGGNYGDNYNYLECQDKERYYDKKYALCKGTKIEILWPDKSTSTHEIKVDQKYYSAPQDYAYNDNHAHISIKCNGTTLNMVKLSEIPDIYIRILSQPDNDEYNSIHDKLEDNVKKRNDHYKAMQVYHRENMDEIFKEMDFEALLAVPTIYDQK